jgi:hypothetical protein
VKPHVLVIATYHVENPSRDAFNVQDDVFGVLRQRQVRGIVKQLVEFAPTKVAMDFDASKQTALDRQYRDFREGKLPPPRSEAHQLAFGVARAAGHERIHGIDWAGGESEADPFSYAFENDQEAEVQPLLSFFERQTARLNVLLHTATVLELLRFLNDGARLRRENVAYLRLARVGKGQSYPGVDWLASWYERNLRIFANVLRITESTDERILIVYGSGHVPLLMQYLRGSKRYQIEPAGRYL